MTSNRRNLTENDIEFILANTDFTRAQVENWYSEFSDSCPQGNLDKANFIKFYSQLMRIGANDETSRQFCESVFAVFDTDSNGHVDFAEFLLAFWVRARGSLKDKLNWLFDVYDTDKSGYIGQYELTKALRLIFAMKGIKGEDPHRKMRSIFETLDRSIDGRLSRQEFIAGCTRDENLRNLFSPF